MLQLAGSDERARELIQHMGTGRTGPFIVEDFGAIRSRPLPWLDDETGPLQSFQTGKTSTAEPPPTGSVPGPKYGGKAKLRQKGKPTYGPRVHIRQIGWNSQQCARAAKKQSENRWRMRGKTPTRRRYSSGKTSSKPPSPRSKPALPRMSDAFSCPIALVVGSLPCPTKRAVLLAATAG